MAIEASGLSLDRLQARVHRHGVRISITTLSYWRSGRSQPERAESLRALRILEATLGVPPDSLRSLLGPPRVRGRRKAVCPNFTELYTITPYVEQMLTKVGWEPGSNRMRHLSVHEFCTIDANRTMSSIEVREVLAAGADGLNSTFLLYATDVPGAIPEVTRSINCRPRRMETDAETGTMVAEMVFDRELSPGESTMLEYEVRMPDGQQIPYHQRVFKRAPMEYVLGVRYTEPAVPKACHSYFKPNSAAPEMETNKLWVSGSHNTHMVAASPAVGIHGVRWDW
ncbi:XRE family transcriptional regulator [Pseudonocardiaceae bacterium YIM PH 21723]|nr:XRE family transcriptional regulator [Pseudonocardiaceae bacterium YIM PH 21723]